MSEARASRSQSPGDFDQELVAGGVTEPVVDGFEAVEIDEDQRDVGRRSAGLGGGALGAVLKESPVGQTGEAVVKRLVPDLVEEAGVQERTWRHGRPCRTVARAGAHRRGAVAASSCTAVTTPKNSVRFVIGTIAIDAARFVPSSARSSGDIWASWRKTGCGERIMAGNPGDVGVGQCLRSEPRLDLGRHARRRLRDGAFRPPASHSSTQALSQSTTRGTASASRARDLVLRADLRERCGQCEQGARGSRSCSLLLGGPRGIQCRGRMTGEGFEKPVLGREGSTLPAG